MGVRSRVLIGCTVKKLVAIFCHSNLQAGYLGTSARHPCSVCSAWGEYLDQVSPGDRREDPAGRRIL